MQVTYRMFPQAPPLTLLPILLEIGSLSHMLPHHHDALHHHELRITIVED